MMEDDINIISLQNQEQNERNQRNYEKSMETCFLIVSNQLYLIIYDFFFKLSFPIIMIEKISRTFLKC